MTAMRGSSVAGRNDSGRDGELFFSLLSASPRVMLRRRAAAERGWFEGSPFRRAVCASVDGLVLTPQRLTPFI